MLLSYVENLLLTSKDKPAGVDNLDAKLLKNVANILAIPNCHVLNLTLESGEFRVAWKIAEII